MNADAYLPIVINTIGITPSEMNTNNQRCTNTKCVVMLLIN